MKIDWDFQGVGKPFEPFNAWLRRTRSLERLSFAAEEERPEILKCYLSDQGLEDIEIGEYKYKETVIRFRLRETGKYWHQTTWWGCYQRSNKNSKIDANQTLILDPLIYDLMEARGTPVLRLEGSSNKDRKIFFYSPRYHWICCQNWKTIRTGCIDSRGVVAKVTEDNWQHDLRSICGQTEFVQYLIWDRFKGIVDEEWKYQGPRSPIPCRSFDGFEGTFTLNNILTGNTTGFTMKSAPDRKEYLRETIARQGYVKTGQPWILDDDALDFSKWQTGDPIPFFFDHEEFGRERYKCYWGHLFDDERTEKRLEGAWDRTEFIRNRFAVKGYEISPDWRYGKADAKAGHRPIPFRHKDRWYRMSWNYFNSGVRVQSNLYLYFVTLEAGGKTVHKLGITQNEIYKRFPRKIIKEVHMITEPRSEPQIKEVEAILLYVTKKYSVEEHLPSDFEGRTECRSLSMDIQKTLKLINKVFDDIDRKFAALPEII